MSGLEPFILAVSTGLTAASRLSGMRHAEAERDAQAARMAQQRQQEAEQSEQADRQRQEAFAHRQEMAEREQRQAALRQRIEERKLERQRRKETASARARLGAAGIGSVGGSGAAVLRGLNREHDIARSQSRKLHDLSLAPSRSLLEEDRGSQLVDITVPTRPLPDFGSDLYRTSKTVVGLLDG